MESSLCRNCSSMLSSQTKVGSFCMVTLPGLCLAGWFDFHPIVLTQWHSPTGMDECPGMGDHLLGCTDVLETRCSNQLHHWTHEIVSRVRPANETQEETQERG